MGTHWNEGRPIFILDRRDFLFVGQLLVLKSAKGDTREPIGLLQIETHTDRRDGGYPQATLIRFWGQPEAAHYIMDATRWCSFEAHCLVPTRLLSRGVDDVS